ncbi:MAG: 3-hydroxyacyl-CoA dehydrogenase NAD-binding domain-containing protein [Gemmatimonadota bacterium]|nr:3-hydroxyacyl-CoA dehydrogenase NAD-binding domain-containing protein [Gemmatimonadota bacterium]MDH3366614.1 3-hydroxyacyl-CoA dehydrogenase NAD-binding domain-containing protein [Gemmatimonadota bacterium]MDH3476860.1 3-hydroxyacyl-CoA dehydrogenase NAD-binding domain-containing protein [Gemmatimonadota bacterium]MDH5548484.1 3-hydroxyacyl-CoA dehydrogenase NAD-binding domain-containing protein [Gemmatimonadota bacterium]
MTEAQVRVAIVGTGDVGRGWAALCVAQGWPVALFDTNGKALHSAAADIETRARHLVELERADPDDVAIGLERMVVGRSILETCRDAQWVIECAPEDLLTKQRLFESIESVAGEARLVTSSSSALKTADIVARCIRQDRCLIAHPLNPPELIPLVEIVPGPTTDLALVELLKGWLRGLDRIPVLVKKSVAGSVVNRIAAAVWREAIDLVLEGVVDVQDLDRAVSLGPALGWAAGGPHLSYHLASGDKGVSGFLQHLLKTFEMIWEDLATWTQLEPEQQRKLIHLIEKAYDEQVDALRPARDRRLGGILRGMERVREKES